jgi:hypothetical protein
MAKISLIGQIAEVRRELAMRHQVYPRQVSAQKMRSQESEMLIGRMEAVLETLEFVQRHEAEFREYHKAKHPLKELA